MTKFHFGDDKISEEISCEFCISIIIVFYFAFATHSIDITNDNETFQILFNLLMNKCRAITIPLYEPLLDI